MAPHNLQQSLILSLPYEILLEIFSYCRDDMKTLVYFAQTCSTFWKLLSESGEELWMPIWLSMMEKNQAQQDKSQYQILYSKEQYENMTLSKSRILMKLIKTQKRYERKLAIVKQVKKLKKASRFRYLENLKIEDRVVLKLIAGCRAGVDCYAPSFFLEGIYQNNPLNFIYNLNPDHFHIKDIIDCLFKKMNAHLELNIHHRKVSSFLYKYWKAKTETMQIVNFQFPFFTFRNMIKCTTENEEDVILFLKFFFLECPNLYKLEDKNPNKTGFEEERLNKGSFTMQLEDLKKMNSNYPHVIEGINKFTALLNQKVEKK